MKKTIDLFLIGFLIYSNLAYALVNEKTCDPSFMNVTGSTISECRESAAKYSNVHLYGDCIGVTAWMATWASLEAECNKIVMNKTLDKRLFSLKRSVLPKNKRYFISEMNLQALFLKGVRRYCQESYEKCQGTMWIPSKAACPGQFYSMRDDQGNMINRGQLKLPEADKKLEKIKNKIPTQLIQYADHLCNMPFDVWKDGKVPLDCVNRVLSSLNMHPDLCLEF
jgi:hypothetical protein